VGKSVENLWKAPYLVGKSNNVLLVIIYPFKMVMFHSDVSLPEGIGNNITPGWWF
jgi:hypothetical protein